jgi:hypothetical protein
MLGNPLEIQQSHFDSVGPHPASSSAVVKKLVDVRGVPENRDRTITVVVDDRGNERQARGDIQIFTQLAHVDRFLDLQARAKAALTLQ